MPTPVIEACDIPTVFEPAVEKEYFPQKITGTPEIIFFGASAKSEFHCLFRIPLGIANKRPTVCAVSRQARQPKTA